MAVSTFGSATLKSQVSNDEEEMNCGSCAQDLKNVFRVQFCLLFSPWGFPSSYWLSHRCELCFASLFFFIRIFCGALPIGSFTTNW
jgi:hypothetical protein